MKPRNELCLQPCWFHYFHSHHTPCVNGWWRIYFVLMRDRKVLFIYAKFQKPRQSSIVAASHNIPWGPELPRGQNYPTLPYFLQNGHFLRSFITKWASTHGLSKKSGPSTPNAWTVKGFDQISSKVSLRCRKLTRKAIRLQLLKRSIDKAKFCHLMRKWKYIRFYLETHILIIIIFFFNQHLFRHWTHNYERD